MASFRSNEEFFQAVADLIARLEAGGHPQAAAELREGFGCLNGLTDGCALFLTLACAHCLESDRVPLALRAMPPLTATEQAALEHDYRHVLPAAGPRTDTSQRRLGPVSQELKEPIAGNSAVSQAS